MRGRTFILPLIAMSALGFAAPALAGGDGGTQLFPGDDTQELCRVFSSEKCVAHMWASLDSDNDAMLSAAEIDTFMAGVERWIDRSDKDLGDRAVVKVALTVYNLTGTERIIGMYDTDADGMLSYDEAFADIELDERPIAAVMLDNDAINAEQLADRFGFLAPQLVRLAQAAGNRLVDRRGGDVTAIAAAIEAEGDEQATAE